MSERQPRVPQEADGQGRPPTDASEACAQWPAERKDVGRAQVGELAPFDVAPDLLDRIQLRGVAGQAFDREPRPGAREIQIGRASCRERVWIWGVAVGLKKRM